MSHAHGSLARGIAARATPLWDRDLTVAPRTSAAALPTAQRRLVRWRKVIGGADPLNTRLRNGELPPDRAAVLLAGAEQDVAEGPLPPWAHTLESMLDRHARLRGVGEREARGDRSFDPATPLPFQEVLVDFVRHARDRLRTRGGSAADVLSLAAATALERQLLDHLAFVAGLTVGRDFYEFRFARAPASAFESAWRRQAPSTDIYAAYVEHMRSGGLVALLHAHPVLARLLCQSVDQWTCATGDFCRRFEDDFADLRATFGWEIERPDGAIADLRTGLSDRHYGGRSVIDCTLRTGERVIYKPRTVQPEVVFYRFIGWLNRRTLSLGLRELQALDRNTHGWVERVAAASCNSHEEVERFYKRAGMLLAVLHGLAITDIHCENVIASGEQPVIVDLESLLDEQTGESPDGEPSVLSTGLLPRWQTTGEGYRFDMSALGADAAQDWASGARSGGLSTRTR